MRGADGEPQEVSGCSGQQRQAADDLGVLGDLPAVRHHADAAELIVDGLHDGILGLAAMRLHDLVDHIVNAKLHLPAGGARRRPAGEAH
ncbi:hypothetical protein Asp14428_70140 [Actinoplanes sp. NBRC 14428]|nr:hypothetical protein Asp14428_70140 [Actinoplanes sp. NBRC 14428]